MRIADTAWGKAVEQKAQQRAAANAEMLRKMHAAPVRQDPAMGPGRFFPVLCTGYPGVCGRCPLDKSTCPAS